MGSGLEGYRRQIETGLRDILDEREREDPLYHPIEQMLSMGGKRLRPTCLLMACEMFGGELEEGLRAALGIEVFHNFTLMHDDLMDEAPLRRGKATVHQSYGSDMAILSGDAMFVKAYAEMSKVEDRLLRSTLSDFNRVALEVCEGQRMDMDFEERWDVGVDDYLRMIVSKTGALLGGALAIGARIGGGSIEEVQGMELLGRNAGVAFQIQDDLLDVYGDEGKVGKRKGGDIVAGKKTYLLIRAFEKANVGQREKLGNALKDPDEERRVEDVIRLYDELGVQEEARERSQAYFAEAMNGLERSAVTDAQKASLRSLLAALRGREA